MKIITYSDASFRNLPDQISSAGGHVIFIADQNNNLAPIGWSSNKIKRVVGSTGAAEGLELQTAISLAIFLRAVLMEIIGIKPTSKIPIESFVDSNNCFQAVNSTKFVEDKRLRLDIAQIQECVRIEDVSVHWVPAERMLADCLTKSGASSQMLLSVLQTGRLQGEEKKKRD